jgi:hypothetical protein
VAPGRLVEFAAGLSECSSCEGEPWDESEAFLVAVFDYVFVRPVANVVDILDADDLRDLACLFDLGQGYPAKTDVFDLALFL